jgi:predicted ATPase/DNA-binding SARP family transcriptional activator
MPEPIEARLVMGLLGPLVVLRNGGPIPGLRTRKGQWLLALLALRSGREVERSWLGALLWPESGQQPVMANLRSSLKDLRRALGLAARWIASPTPRTLRLELAGVEADVVTFDAAIARGDPAALEEAVALYRGPLLEGCAEMWVLQERSDRQQSFLGALERLAGEALANGDVAAAERHLRRAVASDPLRESAHRLLMQVLASHGNYAAALQAYRDLRLLLHREANAEPDPETRDLVRQLQAEVARRQQAANALGNGQAAPANGMSPPGRDPSPGHNLPYAATRFVGREPEMAEVRRLLASTRLLTITGSGGCGKSRLALEAAHSLRADVPGGVWLVELAPLADPERLPQAVAAALEVKEGSAQPLLQTLVNYLRQKTALLQLDNCEHLIEPVAGLANTLLAQCPNVRLLATSREALAVSGESIFRIPPLSFPPLARPLPDPQALVEFAAVRLFVDRASAVLPSFRLNSDNAAAVARICARLNGIPLALELAAARASSLPLDALAQRLDTSLQLLSSGHRSSLKRHRTLRATIDWGYYLLSPLDQLMLQRLSVFAGGWTLEAAEEIGCGPPLTRGQVLELLSRLVDRSLVQYEEGNSQGRYRLLETVREYARERFEEAGGTDVARARHRGHFLALAEAGAAEVWGPAQRFWFERLEADHDNLRAALQWTEEQAEVETGLRLAGAMGPFWAYAGYLSEGLQQFEKWLALSAAQMVGGAPAGNEPEHSMTGQPVAASVAARTGTDWNRAVALFWSGVIARYRQDRARAQAFLQEGLQVATATGNRRMVSACLLNFGSEAVVGGNWAEGDAHREEALIVAREIDDPRLASMILCELGHDRFLRGDRELARANLTEALALARACGNLGTAAIAVTRLGELMCKPGDHLPWRLHTEQALGLARESGNVRWLALVLTDLGLACLLVGDLEMALHHLAEALDLQQRMGDAMGASLTLLRMGDIHRDKGDHAAARGLYEEPLRCWVQSRNLRLCIYGFERLGAVTLLEGQPERAALLFGVAAALREAAGVPLRHGEAARLEPLIASARAALGEAEFAAAWAEGKAMALDEALEHALGGADAEAFRPTRDENHD